MANKTNNANANAAKGARGNFATIDAAGAATIAAALLRKYKSRQGIKAHGAELRAKYGADNWRAIDKAVKAQRAGEIDAETAGARAGVRALAPALEFAYKQARKNGHFGKLETLAAAKYATPAEFIAACYSHVIDGAPACRVSYVAGDGRTIVDAYQLAAIDGRNAASIIDACIGNFGRALNAANKGGKAYTAPAKAETAGKVFAAYTAKDGEVAGTISKGDKVTDAETLAAYARGNVAGLETLAAYNAAGRKAAKLAKAAAALAAMGN